MPLSDHLTPAGLSKEEKEILKSCGGWTHFMLMYELKPWNDDDAKEGREILKWCAEDVREEKKAEEKEKEDAKTEERGNAKKNKEDGLKRS